MRHALTTSSAMLEAAEPGAEVHPFFPLFLWPLDELRAAVAQPVKQKLLSN